MMSTVSLQALFQELKGGIIRSQEYGSFSRLLSSINV